MEKLFANGVGVNNSERPVAFALGVDKPVNILQTSTFTSGHTHRR